MVYECILYTMKASMEMKDSCICSLMSSCDIEILKSVILTPSLEISSMVQSLKVMLLVIGNERNQIHSQTLVQETFNFDYFLCCCF